ncbi:MAG TPA: DUF692 family protein, partial [Thermomicrobiaceae bacterium]|nr:DUF692 family protein [Thermomicrobiaceae bacterium]
ALPERSAPRLGVKWSPAAREVLPLIDLIEVNGWGLAAKLPPVPVLLHNLDLDFSLTTPGILSEEWAERAAAAIARTGSPWFSLHLGFSAERVRFAGHMLPDSAPLDRAVCLERTTAAARFLRERLDVPLLLENLDYCPEGAYEHICQPDFIAEVVAGAECGLLLDLAHLRVSADWLGYEPIDYLARLPLERVVEVHLSGPRRLGARLDDSHRELTAEDEEVLRWLLGQCAPRAVVLEYDRDAARLRQQVERLRGIVASAGTVVAPAPD